MFIGLSVNGSSSTTGANPINNTTPSHVSSTSGLCTSEDMSEAYAFSYKNGLTTMQTCEKANMYGQLFRRDAAKIISNYAINILNKLPDAKKKCLFNDMESMNEEYKKYATLACQLGIMGIDNGTNDVAKNFEPNALVTKAQFAVMISRLLYGTLYNGDSNNWYAKHVEKLTNEHIITITTDILNPLPRGWAMLMLMRIKQ